MSRIRHKDTRAVIAEVEGENLEGANLRGRDLRGADLKGENLKNTDFREADLRDADLSNATGLAAEQFAGANLDRAKLPAEIGSFEGLKQAEEMSKNCGKYFVGLLLGCAFALLTMASTSDVGFFNDSSTATLPIIGSNVSVVSFFLIAPTVLLCAFIYLHMELQRLWNCLAGLPTVFPDGVALDGKAYPWMLNGFATYFTPRKWRHDPRLAWLQRLVGFTLGWLATPLVLVLLWLRYLRRHDGDGTIYQICLILAGFLCAYHFYHLMVRTLRRSDKPYIDPSFRGWARITGTLLAIALGGTLLGLFSFGAIYGIPEYIRSMDGSISLPPDNAVGIIPVQDQMIKATTPLNFCRLQVPRLLAKLQYSPFADLSEADVAARPSGWTGQKPQEFVLIKSTRLHTKDLRYARAYSAFLVKADLTRSNLDGALLGRADLRQAKLTDTKLHAVLTEANLEGADLSGAHMEEAVLTGAFLEHATGLDTAHLHHANLSRAHLYSVIFTSEDVHKQLDLEISEIPTSVDLSVADLGGADLRHADLRGANLTETDLKNAHLCQADLRGTHLKGAKLYGADLNHADLRGLDFREVDIDHTVLSGANLSDANLSGLDLEYWSLTSLNGADLTRAVLESTDLSGQYLTGVDLRGADLYSANLEDARFPGAHVRAASFKKANLRNADFTGADLPYADFRGADLRGAKGLTQDLLDHSWLDQETKLDRKRWKVHYGEGRPISDGNGLN